MPSTTESATLWIITLVIAVVVLVVAAALLTVVRRIATDIDNGAKQIWVVGKNVANCTIQLSLLGRTNQLVADILETATGILAGAGRIARHAGTCGGCPRCVLASSGAGGEAGPSGVRPS
ncbi:MAG: hypothetical protein ACYDAC_05160 [Candidatus Dormibacteria bacterium]